MIDPEVLDALLRNVQLAYDVAAINAINHGSTHAEIAKATVREALLCAEGNGLITVVPREAWPPWITSTPPYQQ
jgi:hypothetical protein